MSHSDLGVYSCRMCDRIFHDIDDMIGIYSDEGCRLQIAYKIFYTLSIMTTENDPTSKYICKVCSGHLECNFKFSWSCRSKNYNIVNNLMKLPHHNTYCEELKKMLKLPFQSLYFNSSVSIHDGYDTVINYMKNPESDLQTFNHFLEHRVLNEFESNKPSTNRFTQIPPSGQLNIPFTNRLNIGSRVKKDIPVVKPVIPRITILNRNQIVSNTPTISNNTNDDNNLNDAQSRVNETNVTENVEVISVESSTSDDDDNNDNNDIQVVETNANPLGTWMINNNNNRVEKPKVSKDQINRALQNVLQTKRKLVPLNSQFNNQNSSSKRTTRRNSSVSNVASEDVTITPDMPLLNIDDTVSPFNQAENNYYEQPPHNTVTSDPPLVTPETGIHFLFEPRETVDLTTESPKKKPERKRKIKNDTKKSPPAKKICQKTSIVPENEENKNLSPPESSSVEPSITTAKKKICQKTLIVPENDEDKNLSPPESFVEPSIKAAKKKICQKTLIVPKNDEDKNLSPPESSVEPSIKAAKKKICRKTPIVPEKKEKKKPSSPVSLSVKSRITAAKKTVAPTPKRFSKRLLYKPKVKQLRPKRVTNIIYVSNELKKYSHLLGKYIDGTWNIKLSRLELPKYKCPICDTFLASIRSRQNHETLTHFLPLEFPPPSVKPVLESENTYNMKQQEFLFYLNLIKKMPMKQNSVEILASRPNVLKSLEIVGNTIDSYNCHHCEFNTTRLFILWAHITCSHNEPVIEKKSNPVCFLCDRSLNKRTNFLKHVEQCIVRLSSETTFDPLPVKHFTCDICNDNFNSSSDLEKHFYNHVAIARQNKNKSDTK